MSDPKFKSPPGWANRFLEWYCGTELLDEIQGDLLEAFYYRSEEVGDTKARWWFIWDVIRFFRPSSFRTRSYNSKQTFMIKNNIKIALRVISRKKWASFINIISLTLGITAVTLISFFVIDEFSYDNFHENKSSIYRMVTDRYLPDGTFDYTDASHPLPMAAQLSNDFSEIEKTTRVADDELYLRKDGNVVKKKILFADKAFFEIFSFPFLVGNDKSALEYSESIVITEKLAMQYFQSIDVVGKTLEIRQEEEFKTYQITGVVSGIPTNSTFKFDVVMNYDQTDYYSWAGNSWGVRIDEIYMLLNANVDIDHLNAKVKDHWKKYISYAVEESKTYKGDFQNYWLQPLTEVHMAAEIDSSFSTSDPMNSYILSGIAVMILLIGCSNFTILSIGRSTLRGKEVAVRKVIGAERLELIAQFWMESITMSFFAMLLSLLLVFLLLPAFNVLAEKSFVFADFWNWKLAVILPLIALMTGVVAGAYPAIVMSGIKILDFFKKKLKLGGANLFTKSLITVQFSLSLTLLLGAIIVFQQINFFKVKDLGYDKSNIVILENNLNTEPEKVEVFQSLLAKNPKIDSWTGINSSFGRGAFSSIYKRPDGSEFSYSMYFVEPSFFEVLGIDLVNGRNFSITSAADSNNVIVNEKFMTQVRGDFDLEDNLTDFKNAGLKDPRIIGVSQDFHFQSLASELKPVVLVLSKSKRIFGNLLIKLNQRPDSELLQFLEDSWYEVAPDSPYSYAFMDDDLEGQYKSEMRWFMIVKYATIWALGLAVLGLLGIVGMSVSGRLKEVSIRKVLGAGAFELYYILLKQFIVLLIIAGVIAVPITVYFANDWLEGFAYHIQLSPLLFGGVFLFIFLLIISIVYLSTSRALKVSPVDSLRME